MHENGKTAVMVIIMIISGIIGTIYDDSMDGAILFSLIAGIARKDGVQIGNCASVFRRRK